MKHDDVKDVVDIITYMRLYAHLIYVRVQVDGKWTNASLAELSDRKRSECELRFIEEGRIPVRLLTDEEMAENAKQAEDEKDRKILQG